MSRIVTVVRFSGSIRSWARLVPPSTETDPRKNHLLTLALAAPLLALAACAAKDNDDTGSADSATDSGLDSDTGTDTDTDSGGDDTGTDATIAITGPTAGDSYLGPTVTYSVAGLTMVDDMGGAPVDGQGHVHIKVDGVYVDATAELSYTLTADQLPAGQHEVSACLAGNDHTELGPCDSITLNVLNPQVAISAPAANATLDSRGVQVAFTFSDFAMSTDVGEANTIGLGHYHLMVDGAYFALGTDPSQAYITHLSSGMHELAVELVNNDHSSLPTPVMAMVMVNVPANAADIRVDSDAVTTGFNSATVPVEASVENFTLDPDISGTMPNMPGMGHYHVYVDGTYTTATGADLVNLLHQSAGDHVVTVVLANYDHSELGARDTMTVNVAESRPDVMITSPPSGESVTSTFSVSVEEENFLLDPDHIGGGDVDGVGHYHVYIDGAYYGYSADHTTTVTGISPGDHTLRVELVNNDHPAHDPVVYDEVPIHVM